MTTAEIIVACACTSAGGACTAELAVLYTGVKVIDRLLVFFVTLWYSRGEAPPV